MKHKNSVNNKDKEITMETILEHLKPVGSVVLGVLVLVKPEVLGLAVGIYFIANGILKYMGKD